MVGVVQRNNLGRHYSMKWAKAMKSIFDHSCRAWPKTMLGLQAESSVRKIWGSLPYERFTNANPTSPLRICMDDRGCADISLQKHRSAYAKNWPVIGRSNSKSLRSLGSIHDWRKVEQGVDTKIGKANSIKYRTTYLFQLIVLTKYENNCDKVTENAGVYILVTPKHQNKICSAAPNWWTKEGKQLTSCFIAYCNGNLKWKNNSDIMQWNIFNKITIKVE